MGSAVRGAGRPLVAVEGRGSVCRTAILAVMAISNEMRAGRERRTVGRSVESERGRGGRVGSPKVVAGSVTHCGGLAVLLRLEATTHVKAVLARVLSSLLMPTKKGMAISGRVEISSPSWSLVAGTVAGGRPLKAGLRHDYALKTAGRQDFHCGRIHQEYTYYLTFY